MKNITQQETAIQMKKRHQKELDEFEGLFFAFNNNQFKDGCNKVGASAENKILSIGAGGYLLKNRLQDFENMFKRQKQEIKKVRLEQKTINIKFVGVNGWNNPIFKSIDKPYRFYGSTIFLFDLDATETEVLSKIDEDSLCYFGDKFDSDPMGTEAGNIKIIPNKK